jgi:regulator of nucleoside diphosphate kinase
MNSIFSAERTLTELDFARLNRLQGGHLPSVLAGNLDFSDLVPSKEIPPDVVTMWSQVEIHDQNSGAKHKLTLCYPEDAEPSVGFISVLSPVGASLLGLRVGSIARWQAPHGEECAAVIARILFQPEASGDYII